MSHTQNHLIFGYTWDEIRTAQQGGRLAKPITAAMPQAKADLSGDVDLLTRFGLDELKNRKYFGVIDRLTRAGIVSGE